MWYYGLISANELLFILTLQFLQIQGFHKVKCKILDQSQDNAAI